MTESEYFEFLQEYWKLFSHRLAQRERIVMDPGRIKL